MSPSFFLSPICYMEVRDYTSEQPTCPGLLSAEQYACCARLTSERRKSWETWRGSCGGILGPRPETWRRGGSHWWVFLGRGCEVMSLESRACVLWEPPISPFQRALFFSSSLTPGKKASATKQPFAMQIVSRRGEKKKRKGIPESMVLYQSADC